MMKDSKATCTVSLGDDPARLPGRDPTGIDDSVAEDSKLTRRIAGRKERDEVQEIKGQPSILTASSTSSSSQDASSSLNSTSPTSSCNIIQIEDDDDADDAGEVDIEAPGSIASICPSPQSSQCQVNDVVGNPLAITNETDHFSEENTIIPPEDDDDDDDKSPQSRDSPLPVATEALLIMDADVAVVMSPRENHYGFARENHYGFDRPAIPVKWVLMGVCGIFVFVIAFAAPLGVLLGRADERSAADKVIEQPPFQQPTSGQPNIWPTVVETSFFPSDTPSLLPSVAPSMVPSVRAPDVPVRGSPTRAPSSEAETTITTDAPMVVTSSSTDSPTTSTMDSVFPTFIMDDMWLQTIDPSVNQEVTAEPDFWFTDFPTITPETPSPTTIKLMTPSPTIQPVTTSTTTPP